MKRLLVLRPEPAASATVSKARELGLDAVAVPLFTIRPIEWEAPEAAGFDALLLTSANAVRLGGEQLKALRGLPAYAVGAATADAARDAGFDIAATGDIGVDRLLGSIDGELRLLHLCGADRHEPRHIFQKITVLPVYQAEPVAEPDLDASRAAVALVHSPRAAQRFSELTSDRAGTSVVAISQAAAKALGPGWELVAVAEQPNDDALLALAARLCKKPATQ